MLYCAESKRFMKIIRPIIFAICIAATLLAAVRVVRLFDGKSFKGWNGDQKIFRIENGAIVGGSLQEKISQNEFLCTDKEYGNFVLRAKFKLVGDPTKANAGIQFRSQRIPNNNEVSGYQADLGQNYWGALYDESRRKKVLAQPNLDELKKVLKMNDWNQYEIRAEGKHLRLSINGFQTVDYTEAEQGIAEQGCICVQIHAGPPSQASYKDITIEEIK